MISVPEAALLPSVFRPMRDFKLAHDLGRKAVRVERERLRKMDADHLPMTGGRIFSR